jgi:hypothetical protein
MPAEDRKLPCDSDDRYLGAAACTDTLVDSPPCDRDDVQRSVELAVAAAVKAVTLATAGGNRDRRDTGGPREMRVAGEALRAGCLSDQDRGAEWAAAGLGEQLGALGAHEVSQLALELLRLARDRGDPSCLLARNAHPGGLAHRSQSAGDALELPGVVELARRDRGLQLRVENDEVDP